MQQSSEPVLEGSAASSSRRDRSPSPGQKGLRMGRTASADQPALAILEQLCSNIVAFLNAPEAALLHDLEVSLDQAEGLLDPQVDQAGEDPQRTPLKRLTRSGRLVVLSVFGALVAYPHLPTSPMWAKAPPFLILSSILTLWAISPNALLALPEGEFDQAAVRPENARETHKLLLAVQALFSEIRRYDADLEKALAALQEVEAASDEWNGQAKLRCLSLREAILASVKRIEEASQGCVARIAATGLISLSRVELKLLVDMYAPSTSGHTHSTSQNTETQMRKRSPNLSHLLNQEEEPFGNSWQQSNQAAIDPAFKPKRASWVLTGGARRSSISNPSSPIRHNHLGYPTSPPGPGLGSPKVSASASKKMRRRVSEQFATSTSSPMAPSFSGLRLSLSHEGVPSSSSPHTTRTLDSPVRSELPTYPNFSASTSRRKGIRPLSTPNGALDFDGFRWSTSANPAFIASSAPTSTSQMATMIRTNGTHTMNQGHHLHHHHQASSLSLNSRSRPTSLFLSTSPNSASLDAPPFHSTPNATVDRLSLAGLRNSTENMHRERKRFLCHLLALKRDTESRTYLPAISVLHGAVHELHSVFQDEAKALRLAVEEEFGSESSAVLLLSPGLIETPRAAASEKKIYIPGSYPNSPVIEIDSASSPPRRQRPSPSPLRRSFSRSRSASQTHDFAPRDPVGPLERQGRDAYLESYSALHANLRHIAARLHVEKIDLDRENEQGRSGSDDTDGELRRLIAAHESLKSDLDDLVSEWNAGRVALRQIAEGRRNALDTRRRLSAEGGQDSAAAGAEMDRSMSSTRGRATPALSNEGDDESKRGSVSSVLSSEDIDPPTPEGGSPPHSSRGAKQGRRAYDVSTLLLEQTNPTHLPPFGMEEQLFEAFTEPAMARSIGKPKLSREERIALAKLKREQEQTEPEEKLAKDGEYQPAAQRELVAELKDVMSLLK